MRVLMTGGGTGGHVNPALAIAETVKQHEPDSEIAYVGSMRGIENKLVPEAGYRLYRVEIKGIKRSLSPSNLKALYLALTSPAKAKKIIREFKPDIVIGTGGYVSWPVVKAASEMNIPCALHESNAVPGMAVKMLEGSVDRIYLNFEGTGEHLHSKDKLVHVGNPLRSGFSTADRAEARRRLGIPDKYKYCLLSFGGSLGAQRINETALAIMRRIVSKRDDIYYVHASGSGGFLKMSEAMAAEGLDKCKNISMREYIFDMPDQLAIADLSINRAGAMTVSEMAMAGKATVFVPSPNVTDNHQFKNAKLLSDANAAILLEETEPEERFISEIERLLSPDGERERRLLSENIRRFAVPDANQRIYSDIRRLIDQKKH